MSAFLSSSTLSSSTSQSTTQVISAISADDAVSVCVKTQQYIQKTFQPCVAAFAKQIETLFSQFSPHLPSPNETNSIRKLAQQITLYSRHCMHLIAPLHTKEFQENYTAWNMQCKQAFQPVQNALEKAQTAILRLKKTMVFADSADMHILKRVHMYSKLHKEWTDVTNMALTYFSTNEQSLS